MMMMVIMIPIIFFVRRSASSITLKNCNPTNTIYDSNIDYDDDDDDDDDDNIDDNGDDTWYQLGTGEGY